MLVKVKLITCFDIAPSSSLGVEDVEVIEQFLVDFDALAAAENEDLRTDAGLTVADAWGRNWTVGDVDNLPR